MNDSQRIRQKVQTLIVYFRPMRCHILLLALIGAFCFSCTSSNSNETQVLSDNWKFSQVGNDQWLPATVPGTVQTDLLKLGKIPDPFLGTNEDSVQWVSSKNWQYETSFLHNTDKKGKQLLRFEGLDTYAKVYLNDSLILTSNNAFRTYEVEVSKTLKERNILRVVYEKTAAQQLPYTLPEGARVFTRKPQFQYGWDWGPKVKTMGIWKPISLVSYETARIEDAFIQTVHIAEDEAQLRAHFTVVGTKQEPLIVEVTNTNTHEKTTMPLFVGPASMNYTMNLTIDNPKLWWTHNLGEPYVYNYKVTIKKGEVVLDQVSKKVGLRTIELITDSDAVGETFYFRLNGKPVYMKGANYIPQNIFLPEVQLADREQLLNDVLDANMNMLRVWGGGVYEDDAFYDMCTDKGILLWQDFMFACAMYPGDKAFLNNVKEEAITAVKRLRQHPSIALWCGNNENSEGWHRWGWQAGKTEAEKEEIWGSYQKIFNEILPEIVSTYQPSVDYWESSPKFGRGDKRYQFEGDAHDWWVWHDGYPFEHFEEEVPRFMSEFGFQSFPSYEAIQNFTQQDSVDLNHPSFATHQKHSRGFSLIKEYMERDFPVPTQAEDYVYVSQLVQAHGITKGIYAHRRARPYNMGTLYWQLNDCWPVVSWSSIDGLGNWKALHYKAKKAFENVIVSTQEKNDSLHAYVVNDTFESLSDSLSLRLFSLDGKLLHEERKLTNVAGGSSQEALSWPLETLSFDTAAVYAEVRFRESATIHYFVRPKDLKLKESKILSTVKVTDDGFTVELQSETLQKDVFLIATKQGKWSDNFFDLLPGETKMVRFKTSELSATLKEIKTLNKF